MILLDTNVISELFKPAPEPKVVTWISRQAADMLFSTSITRSELLYGIYCMQDGRRKEILLSGVKALFRDRFSGRELFFDSDAADEYAEITASRRQLGKPISQFDAMIAAITRARGASLATRNIKDFNDCGIELIDPWNA